MANNICCATYCGGGARIECSCACFCHSTWCCDCAECGGGLLLTCGSTGCLCDYNTFCNNTASCAGGAIRLGGQSCLIAAGNGNESSDCLTIDSNCSQYGGGIYQQGRSCTCLQNFEIKCNQANCYGGGFYTQGCSCFDLCCGKFECNCAKYGGGIYATSACSGCICCVEFCCNCAVVDDAGIGDGYIAAGDANRAATGTGIVGIKHGITDSHGSIAGDPNRTTGHAGIVIATSTDVIICTCACRIYIDRRSRTASIYSPLIFHLIRLIYSFMLSEFVWHRCILYCACR